MSDTIYCAFCGKEIPPETIAKRHYSTDKWPKHVCCDREHAEAFRKQHNDYSRVSKLATNRSAAVAESNRLNPRRKKSS